MLRLLEMLLVRWTGLARRSGWIGVLAILAAAGAAAWYAAGNLRVNTDTSAMLDPNLPFQQRAADLKAAFPEIKSDILIIVRAPTLDETEAFTAALRTRLVARDDQFSGVFAPSADPFFLENGLLYLGERDLESRLTQLTKAAGLIEKLVAQPTAGVFFDALAENDALVEDADLGRDTLDAIYADLVAVIDASVAGATRPFAWMGALGVDEAPLGGHSRLIYATPSLDYARLQPAKAALNALAAEINTLSDEFDGRVETFVTGDPALRADELSAVTKGLGLSFALSFALVAALLLLAFRSAYLAAATLVSLIITIVLTAAFAAAAVGELNLVSVAFTVLLIGLGLDFAIHLVLHIQERRAAGRPMPQAIQGAVHDVGAALALAGPTTAIGFFAFIPTAFDGIAQLGLIAGVGVLIAFMVAVTFLPAALGAAAPRPPRPASGAARRVFSFLERVSAPVAIATTIAGLAALALLPQARFDADPMSLRDPSSQSVRGFQLLFDDPDTVPYRLTRLVDDADDARDTAAAAAALEGVGGVRTIFDFVPDDQDAKLELIDFAAGSLAFAFDPGPEAEDAPSAAAGANALVTRLREAYAANEAGGRLADALDRALATPDTLARAEINIFRHWPFTVERLRGQLAADYVEEDDLPATLSRRYRSAAGLWRVDILPAEDLRDAGALRRFTSTVEAAFPDVGGGALQTQKAGEVISQAMLQATLIALGSISVFLWLLLRRLDDVLLMLFPLGLAAALTAAAGVLFAIPFNYANVIVLPLLLGIGVDSGIHLVMRNRHVKDDETIFGTSTPRAVLFSALTTVASFGSLMLSPHRGTASMGELLSIAIAFTLICTLVVLPAVLQRRNGSGRR